MVKKMNDKDILNILQEKTNRSEEDCKKILYVMDHNFVIGKNNKDRIINELKNNLFISYDEAGEIYKIFFDILMTGLKESIKHPFRNKN